MQEFAEYKANRLGNAARPARPDSFCAPHSRSHAHSRSWSIPGLRPTTSSAPSPAAAEAAGLDVVIVSSDKDMLQLVNDRVTMLNPAKDDEWYDAGKGARRSWACGPTRWPICWR